MRNAGHWVTIRGTHVFICDGMITKGPAHLVDKDIGELKKYIKVETPTDAQLGISPNSFIYDEEYKHTKQMAASVWKEYDEAEKEVDRARVEIPRDQWSENDEFMYSMFGIKPVSKEFRTAIDKKDKLLNKLDSIHKDLDEYGRKRNPPPKRQTYKPVTEDAFKYFTTEGTYSYLLDLGKAEFVEMTPKQYIDLCALMFGSTYEKQVANVNRDSVALYAELMSLGSKAQPLFIDVNKTSQEGRHRAFAAMLLGADKVPVILVKE